VSAWRFAATVATYLLLGLSVADWVGTHTARRRLVMGMVSGIAVFEVALGALQAWRVPLKSWTSLVEFLPAMPLKRWGQDFFHLVGTPATVGFPVGTLGNVNYVAELIVLTIPLLLALAWHGGRWRRGLILAVTGVAMVLLVRASARAAVAGLVLALPLVLLLLTSRHPWHPRQWPRHFQATALALALGIPSIGLYLAWPTLTHFVAHEPALMARAAYWQAVWPVWLAHPLQGIGLGGFQLLSVNALQAAFPGGVPAAAVDQRLMQLHNEPFQILLELGLVGLALAVTLTVTWLRAVLRNETLSPSSRFGLLWGFLALALAAGMGFPLHIPLTALVLTLMVAIGLSGAVPEAAPEPIRRRWPAVAVLTTLGLSGWLVIAHSAWPEFQAHRLEDEAGKYRKQLKWPRAEATLAEADRLARFKGRLRWFELEVLVKQAKYEQAIALYESSADTGMGVDSEFWLARALEGAGRPDEAAATYRRIKAFYAPGSDLSVLAQRGLDRLRASQTPQSAN
jgi:tetratricopeptide (TPR) repeat protein